MLLEALACLDLAVPTEHLKLSSQCRIHLLVQILKLFVIRTNFIVTIYVLLSCYSFAPNATYYR